MSGGVGNINSSMCARSTLIAQSLPQDWSPVTAVNSTAGKEVMFTGIGQLETRGCNMSVPQVVFQSSMLMSATLQASGTILALSSGKMYIWMSLYA